MVVIVPSSDPESEFFSWVTLSATAESVAGRAMVAGAKSALYGDLNARLRVRQMLGEYTPSGGELPSDFLEAETVKVNDVVYQPTNAHRPARCGYSVQNGGLVFNDNEGGTVWLRYYRKLGLLGDSGKDAVMEAYPLVFLYGLLWQHGRLVRDESAQAWGSAYAEALESAQASDIASRMSSVSMAPVPETYI